MNEPYSYPSPPIHGHARPIQSQDSRSHVPPMRLKSPPPQRPSEVNQPNQLPQPPFLRPTSHPQHHQIPSPSDSPSSMLRTASPRPGSLGPHLAPAATTYVPSDRSLPSRVVTDETIDDAYVAYILYCNPTFPTDIDTTELRRCFRSPPKSEGKSFSIFTLYELCMLFFNKHIKTWREVVEELGVEKQKEGQSTQKVQQYGVRLKRWLKVMHMRAFFTYLHGENAEYNMFIPAPSDPLPEIRDEVSLDEDLALRALDPKTFRPKRGRRKLEDFDDEAEPVSAVEPKRPQLNTAISFGSNSNHEPSQSAYPYSAAPHSAHPDSHLVNGAGDPWANVRWRNPQTPHPLSAVTPMSAHPDSNFDESLSAMTPRMKSRRRHGPAVSSAWSNNSTTPNGRLRGRPPANRAHQAFRDGPFVTFPVESHKAQQDGPASDGTRTASPGRDPLSHAERRPSPSQSENIGVPQKVTTNSNPPLISPSHSQHPGRPDKLSLQIPGRASGLGHLMTPTLMINGESSNSGAHSTLRSSSAPRTNHYLPTPSTTTSAAPSAASIMSFKNVTLSTPASDAGSGPYLTPRSGIASATIPKSFLPPPEHRLQQQRHTVTAPQQTSSGSPTTIPTHGTELLACIPRTSTEQLQRKLAGDFLRADLRGRKKRLRGPEAKGLAGAILNRLGIESSSHRTNQDRSHSVREEIRNAMLAAWLGVSLRDEDMSAGSSDFVASSGAKTIIARRFRLDEDGYDSPISDDDEQEDDVIQSALTNAAETSPTPQRTRETGNIKEVFDIEWTSSLAGIAGSFALKGLSLSSLSQVTQSSSSPSIAEPPTQEVNHAGIPASSSNPRNPVTTDAGLSAITEESEGCDAMDIQRHPRFDEDGINGHSPSLSTTHPQAAGAHTASASTSANADTKSTRLAGRAHDLGAGHGEAQFDLANWKRRALVAERENERLKEAVLDVVL